MVEVVVVEVVVVERLLTVAQAAEALNTSERFVRRLISERRIEFTRIGRHVRIRDAAVAAFIDAGRVNPLEVRWRDGEIVA